MKQAFQKRWIYYAAIVPLLIFVASRIPLPNCDSIHQVVATGGFRAQLYYFFVCLLAILIFIPRTPLVFAGGIFFGAVQGTLYNAIASAFAGWIFFKAAKWIKHESFENWLKHQSWFIGIDKMASEQGFLFTLALRMSQFVHYSAGSLALGFSPIKTKDFIAGSLLGILPGTFALAYVGETIGCTALSGFNGLPSELQLKLGISLALITIVGILPLVFSIWIPKNILQPKKKLHVQAHRGVCIEVQENTLKAFERAIEVGADSIELDVHVTKDNKVVVYHDFVLEPEFCSLNGKKITKAIPIRELTYKEIKQYECEVSRRLRGPNTLSAEQRKIPLLADVFALFKSSTHEHAKHMWIDIEIKSDPRNQKLSPPPRAFCKLVVHEVRKGWDFSRTAIRSFDPRITLTLRRKYKHLRVIQLTNGGFVDYARVVKKIKPHVIAPSHKTIQRHHVDFIHNSGIEVMPWTANTEEDWQRLLEWGVDGITTDDPAKLIAYLKKTNPHL